jgi:chorismate mutase-like protein
MTKRSEECGSIDDIRTEINRIDRHIVTLIGERAGYVQAAAKFKTSATDVGAAERFEAMLYQRRAWAEERDLDPDMIEKLYRDMVNHFIQQEMAHWKQEQQEMAFSLNEIVPWGRSFDEYTSMFGLTQTDLSGHILGCGDGPASFNAEATQRGHSVISCDPLYQFSAAQIERRIHETYDTIMEELRPNLNNYVWDAFGSPEGLGQARMTAMRTFLADYERGKREGRYVNARLPSLPFPDRAFDLALCSHLLFLYSEHLSPEFHRTAITEMCRVAREVRIFPLLDLGSKRSIHLAPILSELKKNSDETAIIQVDYEFQKGANAFLCVKTQPQMEN